MHRIAGLVAAAFLAAPAEANHCHGVHSAPAAPAAAHADEPTAAQRKSLRAAVVAHIAEPGRCPKCGMDLKKA